MALQEGRLHPVVVQESPHHFLTFRDQCQLADIDVYPMETAPQTCARVPYRLQPGVPGAAATVVAPLAAQPPRPNAPGLPPLDGSCVFLTS